MTEVMHKPAVDDPAWVLDKYREAKELVNDLREAHQAGELRLPADLREDVEEFWAATFMDECTTFGLDCGCHTPAMRQEGQS